MHWDMSPRKLINNIKAHEKNCGVAIFHRAGIPKEKIEKQTDDTGVILFYQVQK